MARHAGWQGMRREGNAFQQLVHHIPNWAWGLAGIFLLMAVGLVATVNAAATGISPVSTSPTVPVHASGGYDGVDAPSAGALISKGLGGGTGQ